MKITLTFSTLWFLLGAISTLPAQQVSLYFPHFAGQEYHFVILQGDKSDTIGRGAIPEGGRLVLRLPEHRKQYAGMARWMLKSGGGLDFVWNGEDFSVECLSATPNEQNIVFKGSPENEFLNTNFREQERIIAQYEAMQLALNAYTPDMPTYKTFEQEKVRLEKAYVQFQDRLSKSDLYAARFREIVNVTRGLGRTLGGDEARRAMEADDFISRQMSWPALYTSNHWGGIIYSWVQMHLYVIQRDSALVESAQRILSRLPTPELYTAFCDKMAYYFVKNSKDSLLSVLAPTIRSSGKLQRFDGLLAQFNAVQVGAKAPELVFDGSARYVGAPESVQKPAMTGSAGTVLVFYQSGCGPCAETMEELSAQYPRLQANGFRVVAISADMDRRLFEQTAAQHPWPDKYCDGKGFEGPNFRNYGVAGTPTLFVIDKSGKILTRAGGLPDIQRWIERK